MKENKPDVVFAPGCFDSFEGTQEELDALILEINKMVETGELFENSQLLSDEELDALPNDVVTQLTSSEHNDLDKRVLQ